MTLVDSSVWIDFFRGRSTCEVERLDALLDTEFLAMGDLILTEVLQGFGSDKDFNLARKILKPLPLIQLCDRHVAIRR